MQKTSVTSFSSDRASGNITSTLLICVAIIGLGIAAAFVIFQTEPQATREGATKKTAMLVDVTTAESGTFNPLIVAMGTVTPSRDIDLQSRVSGEVVYLSEQFTPGGHVKKGDLLLRLDRADYNYHLQQRKSELQQAEANLAIEMGQQHIARQEYQLLNETLAGTRKALVLREPQLKTARARVAFAQAAVDQARLNLERTRIAAPFDAHLLRQDVNVGSQVAPGDMLGRLVGLDTYWVETTVPLAQLRWLSFAGEASTASEVRIRNRTAWPVGQYRTGHLYQLVGTLEEQTRMARILVTVKDPLALSDTRSDSDSNTPPLMLGEFVETRITGKPIADVVRLDRNYVRKNDTVWVMADDALSIRKVAIVTRDAQYAYIREGLADGDQVITTNLATVIEGAPLRLKADTRPVEANP